MQEHNGSWYGRWGVNYVYGTSNSLCGLAYFCFEEESSAVSTMVDRSLRFLLAHQNHDGGWGESPTTYRFENANATVEKNRKISAPSTASQTAWALMALVTYLPSTHSAIQRGIRYLLDSRVIRCSVARRLQDADEDGTDTGTVTTDGASWSETHYTGTGFPNHFYLGYDLYRHYFPVMALGRYLRMKNAETRGARSIPWCGSRIDEGPDISCFVGVLVDAANSA